MAPPLYAFPTDRELAGRRVVVMGLGLFGGGAAVVRFLASRGARVLVTDLRDASILGATLDTLRDVAFDTVLGEHRARDFESADWVVVNPAVPDDSPFLRDATRAGAGLTSEVGLFVSRCRARLAFVTGSKGKTTTTALLHAMLRTAGAPAVLGGNIGRSLLPEVDRLGQDDVVAYEISSFQLDQLRGLERHPEVAVITNLYEVHLERHGSAEAYRAAKREALAGARHAVLNHDDPTLRAWAELVPRRTFFGRDAAPEVGLFTSGGRIVELRRGRAETEVLGRGALKIPGTHNLMNCMAALAAAEALGAARGPALDAARGFPGVEHRLELVLERDGIRYFNDSIATTSESALAALAALEGGVVLIAGGKEAVRNLEPLARAIAPRVRALVTLGESGPRLARAVRECAPACVVIETPDLEHAFAAACAAAITGDAVLLSPAFPSYDQFRNFRERGERFRALAVARGRAER